MCVEGGGDEQQNRSTQHLCFTLVIITEVWAILSNFQISKIKTILEEIKPLPYAQVITGCRWMFPSPPSTDYQSCLDLSPCWQTTGNSTISSCHLFQGEVTVVICSLKSFYSLLDNKILLLPSAFSSTFHPGLYNSIQSVFIQQLRICITVPKKDNWLVATVLAGS